MPSENLAPRPPVNQTLCCSSESQGIFRVCSITGHTSAPSPPRSTCCQQPQRSPADLWGLSMAEPRVTQSHWLHPDPTGNKETSGIKLEHCLESPTSREGPDLCQGAGLWAHPSGHHSLCYQSIQTLWSTPKPSETVLASAQTDPIWELFSH